MKLSKEVYNYILECIALEDKSWKDEITFVFTKKEEAVKWIKAIWEKQEKAKLKKLKDPKKKLEEWYAKNNVKIGI